LCSGVSPSASCMGNADQQHSSVSRTAQQQHPAAASPGARSTGAGVCS
jgi:hypothetical protein